jgi:hypothetical protein
MTKGYPRQISAKRKQEKARKGVPKKSMGSARNPPRMKMPLTNPGKVSKINFQMSPPMTSGTVQGKMAMTLKKCLLLISKLRRRAIQTDHEVKKTVVETK